MKHIQITSNAFQGTQTLKVLDTAPDAEITPTDASTVRAALARQVVHVQLVDDETDETLMLTVLRPRPSESRVFFQNVITPKVLDALKTETEPGELLALAQAELGIETELDVLDFFAGIKVKVVAAAMQDAALQDEAFWESADTELVDTLFDIAIGTATETPDREAEVKLLKTQLATAETELETCRAMLQQRDADLEVVTERLQTCEKENAALTEQLHRAESIIDPPEDTLFSGDMDEPHGFVKSEEE